MPDENPTFSSLILIRFELIKSTRSFSLDESVARDNIPTANILAVTSHRGTIKSASNSSPFFTNRRMTMNSHHNEK